MRPGFLIFQVLLTLMLMAAPQEVFAQKKAAETVTVKLKNGNAMSGKLVSETAQSITLLWEGSEIGLPKSDILLIERGKNIKDNKGIQLAQSNTQKPWDYKNNPVVELTNGEIVDARIKAVKANIVTLEKDYGDGAFAELDTPLAKIESLKFKPVKNAESEKIEANLRKIFPKMDFHEMGMVTLVTDTEGSSLKTLKKTLREQLMIIYLEFHELFENKQPLCQHYVVVFDNINNYYEYALSDGVPPWLCPGYFMPKDKTLFLMNLFGDRFTGIIYEGVTGVRQVLDTVSDILKKGTGNRYNIQIEGASQEAKKKFEGAIDFLIGLSMEQTLATLRHELTHEFMHNWQAQSIIVSGMKEKNPVLINKKKELLQTKDMQKKRQLIIEMLRLQKNEARFEDLKMEASNSWYVEGLAEYASTTAAQQRNDDRLYELKEAKRKNELLPLEQLTVYKMGSFPGVSGRAALSAYAQSWNLVEFLMKNYRTGFIAYLKRLSVETPKGDQDLTWLLEALGKELRALEGEWHAYIDTLENLEDPSVERWFRVREILTRK